LRRWSTLTSKEYLLEEEASLYGDRTEVGRRRKGLVHPSLLVVVVVVVVVARQRDER